MKKNAIQRGGVNFIAAKLPLNDGKAIKNLAMQLEQELSNALIVFAAEVKGKPQIMVSISKSIVEEKGLNAGEIVNELATEIGGRGGGQAFFATAGGKDVNGLENAITKAKEKMN